MGDEVAIAKINLAAKLVESVTLGTILYSEGLEKGKEKRA